MMKLDLIKKLVVAAIIGVFVVSCMEDPNSDYNPPTQNEELALLNEYIDTLESRGLDIDTTDIGVYYILDSVGVGEYPVDGDTCVLRYTGFFINLDVFDSSGNNTFEIVLGNQTVIEGWEDGLKVFKKNAEGYLIIPSQFAYGSTGYLSIPPYTTLLFYIEMVDIKQAY